MRIGEDFVLALFALKSGCRFGYFDTVHTIYTVHCANSSAASIDTSLEKQLAVNQEFAAALEEVGAEGLLTPSEMRALRWSLAQTYFWKLGYSLLWQHGRQAEALNMFRQGLDLWPWSLSCWKTYLACRVKAWGRVRRRPGQLPAAPERTSGRAGEVVKLGGSPRP